MDAREKNIEIAQVDTCNWLFDTAEFEKWRRCDDLPTHTGMLWIKGKPGAGKSTLMKHALDHCRTSLDGYLLVAYFFKTRGGSLEKTPLSMLRSIALQLLRKGDVLYGHFLHVFREKQEMYGAGRWEWQESVGR